MKLDKKFINKVNDNCYEDKNTTRGIVVLSIALSVLVIIGLIYLIVPDNWIEKNIKITLIIIDFFVLIFSFGLLLICPHKVYKDLKLKEDEKMKNEKR